MSEQRDAEYFQRIDAIDQMFERATCWGSWMVGCANERERLVEKLRASGFDVEHRYQARLTDGSRTS